MTLTFDLYVGGRGVSLVSFTTGPFSTKLGTKNFCLREYKFGQIKATNKLNANGNEIHVALHAMRAPYYQ